MRKSLTWALAMLRWAALLTPMSAIVGSLCAAFLWALDGATRLRFDHPWILFGLPVAGWLVGLVYHHLGRSVEAGSNLILEQIHAPGAGAPLRMAPLILGATVVTHLFGGSAGREGTAVQLGGAIASAFARQFRLKSNDVAVLLMGGVAAGFGAVFGTPVAGAVFALEVLTVGRIQYAALLPCLIAAVVGDAICRAWGIHHTAYPLLFGARDATAGFAVDPLLLLKVGVAGVAFGGCSWAFSEASHAVSAAFNRLIPYPPTRPFVGGGLVIALVYLCGTRDYLGLGVWSPHHQDLTIASFFDGAHIHAWSWALKALFTLVTLGAGFKGGEVTPLFFIGAALGNALSGVLGAPTDLFAALGFVAVFAGAANTPLACTLLGVELFGATNVVYIAAVCFIAYATSGHTGIYLSQQVKSPKHSRAAFEATTLRDLRVSRHRAR